MFTFPEPAHILAGQLHQYLLAWIDLAGSITYPLSQTVLAWLENKVQVQRFFRNFKGNFFESSSPPLSECSTIIFLARLLPSLFLARF